MANEVMSTLFGVTPEALMAERDRQAQEQALAVAKLNPFEQARYTSSLATRQLGNALGGLLGAEDPELMRIRQRQRLLQGIDPNDPMALRNAASTALRSGDTSAAGALAQRALDVESKMAAISKDTAAAQASMMEKLTPDQRNAAALADTKATRGTPEWTAEYGKQLSALTAKEGSKTSYGPEADRLSKALYGKDFRELTKEQANVVDKQLEQRGITKARAGAGNTELKMPPDIVGAVNAVDKATEKEVAMLDSARLAKELINQTAKSNNSQTWEAARTTIAKAVGENKLSNEDIRRTGVDPRLVQGALDWVNKKIEGVPNADIQKQLYVLGSVLENSAAARYDAKIGRFRSAAEASKFPGQPSTYFPTAAERSTNKSIKTQAVDWSTLK